MSPELTVYSPYSGSVLAELPLHSFAEAEEMLLTAHKTAIAHPEGLPVHERRKILLRLAELMKIHRDTLIHAAIMEGGKPFHDSVIEFERALLGIQLAIEAIPRLSGEEIPMGLTLASSNRMAFTRRFPVGAVLAFSAFNHPINLIVHQVITAIAAGCPVVIKPAPTTPLSCKKMVELLHQAQLPPEWCQFLLCDNQTAERLVSSRLIAYFSFIGSPAVGWHLRSLLAPGVRCMLEHGGAAPVIIDEGADISSLISGIAKGGFYHSGQVCVSVQRVFVPAPLLTEVQELLVQEMRTWNVGDPLLPSTSAGPLIRKSEIERISSWIEEAASGGADVYLGKEPDADSCHPLSLVVNPSDTCSLSTKEVFGPVICLYSYGTRTEALQRANAVPFAFQASVFTDSLDTAMFYYSRLQANTVLMNDHTAFRVDWMPFGGRALSGEGTGGIYYAMRDMTYEKMLVLKSQYS